MSERKLSGKVAAITGALADSDAAMRCDLRASGPTSPSLTGTCKPLRSTSSSALP